MNNALEFITINKNPVPAFIFSTRAWNSGDSMQKMARVLKKKNIYTIQMQGFNCPSNGWATFLKPSHIIYKLMVRFEKNLFKNIQKFVNEITVKLVKFEKKPFCELEIMFPHYKLLRIFAERFIENRSFRDLEIIQEKCIHCGLCAKNCPDNNIFIKNENLLLQIKTIVFVV